MTLHPDTIRALEHERRWRALHLQGRRTDFDAAERAMERVDAILDAADLVGVTVDGEEIFGDQTAWVQAQIEASGLAEISENPARGYAVNRTGIAERVIRRIRGDDDDDDGHERLVRA